MHSPTLGLASNSSISAVLVISSSCFFSSCICSSVGNQRETDIWLEVIFVSHFSSRKCADYDSWYSREMISGSFEFEICSFKALTSAFMLITFRTNRDKREQIWRHRLVLKYNVRMWAKKKKRDFNCTALTQSSFEVFRFVQFCNLIFNFSLQLWLKKEKKKKQSYQKLRLRNFQVEVRFTTYGFVVARVQSILESLIAVFSPTLNQKKQTTKIGSLHKTL